MKRAAIVLLAWGAWLGVLTAVLLPFGGARPRSYAVHPIEYWMLGGSSGACLAAGLVLWRIEARRRARAAATGAAGEPPRLIPDYSLATMTLASGLALALLGAGFGLWLVLIGAGVIALGGGGLVRETRARRRALRRLQATSAGQGADQPAPGAPRAAAAGELQ